MTNVIPLFPQKIVQAAPNTDELIMMIANWAEAQGMDIYNDQGFHFRLTDLITHLKIMTSERKQTA